jgi:kynureninase
MSTSNYPSASETLIQKATAAGFAEPLDAGFADLMDSEDSLSFLRSEFLFPKAPEGKNMVYLCGNSLGLEPKRTRDTIGAFLDKWAEQGVEGHFTGRYFRCAIVFSHYSTVSV